MKKADFYEYYTFRFLDMIERWKPKALLVCREKIYLSTTDDWRDYFSFDKPDVLVLDFGFINLGRNLGTAYSLLIPYGWTPEFESMDSWHFKNAIFYRKELITGYNSKTNCIEVANGHLHFQHFRWYELESYIIHSALSKEQKIEELKFYEKIGGFKSDYSKGKDPSF